MKILSVDTTGNVASVAVVDDTKTLCEITLNLHKTHSETLVPMIETVCQMLGLTPNDMDYLAVAVGPGSFTGVRIGVAAIKGIAAALEKKVIPVTTTEALAYNVFGCEKIICPIMDARRNQVYTAFYTWRDGQFTCLAEAQVLNINDVLEKAKAFGQPVVFLGDGVAPNLETIQNSGLNVSFADVNCNLQRAASVGALAVKYAKLGKAVNGADVVPIYLRKPQAEREYSGKGEENA